MNKKPFITNSWCLSYNLNNNASKLLLTAVRNEIVVPFPIIVAGQKEGYADEEITLIHLYELILNLRCHNGIRILT